MNTIYQKFYRQIKSVKNKKIVFWGASLFLEDFLKFKNMENHNTLGVVDKNEKRWGKKLGKYEIISPQKINELKPDYIIISIQNINKKNSKILEKQLKKEFSTIKVKPNVLLIKNNDYIYKFTPLIRLLDNIVPKKKNKIAFLSYPDFSDNPREYYEYLKENHAEEFDIVWLYENLKYANYEKIQRKFYDVSLQGIWHLLTSKYVIYSNLMKNEFCNFNKHVLLQFWHGMPLKTIGYTEPGISKASFNIYKTYGKHGYFFVTSDIFKSIMSSCFLANPNNVFITGQPRTDCILSNRKNNEIDKFINYKNFNKVIIYAPTYKEVVRSHERDIKEVFQNIFYCNDYSEQDFYKFLEENKILLIVKPHPYDEFFYKKYLQEDNLNHPNIKFLFNEDLYKADLYFYDFFKFADLMITDFSSIAIDYLISKKPVIFLNSTVDSYSQNRGFILEDNHEILMAGPKVRTFKELLSEIKNALTIDSWKRIREEKLSLMHKHFDSKASERIYKIMKGLK